MTVKQSPGRGWAAMSCLDAKMLSRTRIICLRRLAGPCHGICVMAAAAMWAGCGRAGKDLPGQSATQSGASQTTAAAASAQPISPEMPNLPTSVPAVAAGGADLRALNHAYVGWIVRTHQRPKTFEEFMAVSGMTVPPPPPGRKYVIDHAGFIALK